MRVLKFGGTSVASAGSLGVLKKIVEQESKKQEVVVVVSALAGITDKLLFTAQLAAQGDTEWEEKYNDIIAQHTKLICEIFPTETQREALLSEINGLLEQLRSIYFGVYLICDLSAKTEDTILSYGERLSSRIVATLFHNVRWIDSREFIKTTNRGGKHILHSSLTTQLTQQTFAIHAPITLVPGFIAADKDTNETTNLGRGGSDYTAAIIAAALDADVLEIWTDVDGFMTADPHIIKTAYTINELSYVEAMELCHFGAKVIYPPTIYPVCVKNIPICVKNTFNPTGAGTLIKENIANDGKLIKGISSIGGISLVHISGLSMVGVIGVNQRIFTALTDNDISVFMVAQASSENSTSIGVRSEDAEKAEEVLNEEFSKEIITGAMFPMKVENGLAAVAIVGENMRRQSGVAGKLFGVLGRAGISVIAFAQGASETNISFVVDEQSLRKSLNVIHDSFFLSEYNVLNLFVCGVGTVGGMLLEQIRRQYELLKETRHLKLNVVGIASSKKAVFLRDGIDLNNYKSLLDQSEESNTEKLLANVIGMNIFNSVFVDCTSSHDIAAAYQQLLEHNINIVAANKIAASGHFDVYAKLKQTAVQRGVKYLFETNVGAGLPIIGTINDLRNSGDEILKIEAVLSGTLNFIFNTLAEDMPFSHAVRLAVEKGYAEPDPRIDLSGKDVVRKLVILAREAGYQVEQEDVQTHLFVPDTILQGSEEEFWRGLTQLDPIFEQQRKTLVAAGKRWRFVATMEQGETSVAIREVEQGHPFYNLEGSNNIVLLTTKRYKEYPMLIQGYGAGASVTAAGVFANIMSIANI